jgi:tRNA-Thr(GGU) m(6)t(6)A37 methyltransferase TsaA
MQDIVYKPIGMIHTPIKDPVGAPIQAIGGKGINGTIEIYPGYSACLKDLDGFSHIILLYHFHLSKGYSAEVKPFMNDKLRGVFSTRAPKRPNPIGLSVVKLIKIEDRILHIEDLDIIDCTPLLDIKPYIPKVDAYEVEQLGWVTDNVNEFSNKRADDWFQ